ncbi:MAG: hypothetical protein K6G55_05140 [Selenomonadaceae bacterium]|nr:hypothetical protein [Selenomonadaceae bacterium]
MLAEKFSLDGDPLSMRTAAREIFEVDANSVEGTAIMAESAFYRGALDDAKNFAETALKVDPKNLRSRLVLGSLAVLKLDLKKQLEIFDELVNDIHTEIETLKNTLRDINRQDDADEEEVKLLNKKLFILRSLLLKALGRYSNGLYLSGDPAKAAASLFEASTLTDNNEQAAELYSKHLFLRNYREVPLAQTKELAQEYNKFFMEIPRFRHENHKFHGKIKVGYISPDFREHAVANFIAPLLRDFDADKFTVTCYFTGKRDFVTDKLKNFPVKWRGLLGKSPDDAAQVIYNDKIDILVDLSGHSQDSCLPILAYKPAPIQICMLGYTATTGLDVVDYFLSDKVCLPENFPTGFTERILRLNPSCLCYAPDIIRSMPDAGIVPPVSKNEYVTFGSFNNFAKVSDDVLYLWRAILEGVPDSRLILKGKIFSLDEGTELVTKRMTSISFPIDRVEFRPYSPDYLEQYHDIDIALDTFPYTGGTTTCEALYMGVPVITMRGKTHGARIAASILTAADCKELITLGRMEYVKKAVLIGRNPKLIADYHAALRNHLKNSALMDGKKYMRRLENIYRSIINTNK